MATPSFTENELLFHNALEIMNNRIYVYQFRNYMIKISYIVGFDQKIVMGYNPINGINFAKKTVIIRSKLFSPRNLAYQYALEYF